MKTPRKTLWSHGRKGEGDWMRVLIDVKQDRAEVLYKDARGARKRELFPNDRKGRADAIAWAESYRDERKRLGRAQLETTHADLWAAFTASPAWSNLREKTKPSYTYRWQRWATFRGARTRPDDTTLHHVDRYIMAATEQGVAINQVRQVLNTARVVYNWGQSRKLISENVFVGYRWTTPKDAVVHEPEEYTEAEFAAVLRELPPTDGRTWRANVALILAGHHGQRANAILHLRWSDIRDGAIVWPAEFQKNGKALEQPLTWDAVAALATARYWRERSGYEGPWVLYAGGGNKRIGTVVTGNARHYRKDRTPDQDTAYTYQGLWLALTKAEQRSKVAHKPRRALHGFRKMAAGNVADATGDARLALRWIGDDIRQAPAYLKRRDEHMERAATASTSAPNESRTSVREVSRKEKAPEGASGTR